MSEPANKIECPNCGHGIDVNALLYQQVDQQLKQKYQDDLASERRKFDEQASALEQQRQQLIKEKDAHDAQIAAEISKRLQDERKKLRDNLKADLEAERSGEVKLLQEEIAAKTEQVKEFNQAKAEVERLKREKDEIKSAVEAQAEKQLSEKLAAERIKLQKMEQERSQLKLAERESLIEQLKTQLSDAQRKAEQGSMQIQGEIQEIALEEWLAQTFPLDVVEEIKKGARGADCLQVVNTRMRQHCGTIYYESKRTKGFQPAWIEKFKHDIRERNADIGVLVTESMPADMPRLGLRDGVWICTFEEFKSLSLVLRESVIKLSAAVDVQDNKGDKMGMLYDFLTGNEFRLQVEAIVEGFTQMQTDLESEKRSMAAAWKKREKQIQKVLLNTTHMYGSVKGIAGNAVQSVPLLEMPNDES